MGQYSCDDGNIEDGDGCSHFCSIENGYTCSGGTKTSPDTCFAMSQPKLTAVYFTHDNSQIVLEFD
jgi:cysteine-rich repeat protein